MRSTFGAAIVIAVFAFPAFAQEKGAKSESDRGKSAKKENDEFATPRRGRAGELSPEEEDRLDRIIDRFIDHDTGRKRDPQALRDMLDLGLEAIPALIRGINKSAQMSHSCPIVMLSKKLKQLVNVADDEEVTRFVRENVGAGLNRNNQYMPLIRDLQVTAMLRQRQLTDASSRAARQQQQGSPGKGP
jgi:hypothetical protein